MLFYSYRGEWSLFFDEVLGGVRFSGSFGFFLKVLRRNQGG
jgi:hypothetical protein